MQDNLYKYRLNELRKTIPQLSVSVDTRVKTKAYGTGVDSLSSPWKRLVVRQVSESQLSKIVVSREEI